MNRNEFIKKIIIRYASFFKRADKDEQVAFRKVWADDYKAVLPENADFKKLDAVILYEHYSPDKPPAPSWLSQKWLYIKEQTYEINKPKKYKKGVPPTSEWEALRAKFERRSKILSRK